MTEQEWLEATDPKLMLEFRRGKASERKLRLFAVACCRSIWELIGDDDREVVEVAEGYAEGLYGEEAIAEARQRTVISTRSAAFTNAGWLSLSATAVEHLVGAVLHEGIPVVARDAAGARACYDSVSEVIAGDVPAWKSR